MESLMMIVLIDFCINLAITCTITHTCTARPCNSFAINFAWMCAPLHCHTHTHFSRKMMCHLWFMYYILSERKETFNTRRCFQRTHPIYFILNIFLFVCCFIIYLNRIIFAINIKFHIFFLFLHSHFDDMFEFHLNVIWVILFAFCFSSR